MLLLEGQHLAFDVDITNSWVYLLTRRTAKIKIDGEKLKTRKHGQEQSTIGIAGTIRASENTSYHLVAISSIMGTINFAPSHNYEHVHVHTTSTCK